MSEIKKNEATEVAVTSGYAALANTESMNDMTSNVLAESILLAMAKNINKLHNRIQKGRTGTHLFPVKSA